MLLKMKRFIKARLLLVLLNGIYSQTCKPVYWKIFIICFKWDNEVIVVLHFLGQRQVLLILYPLNKLLP